MPHEQKLEVGGVNIGRNPAAKNSSSSCRQTQKTRHHSRGTSQEASLMKLADRPAEGASRLKQLSNQLGSCNMQAFQRLVQSPPHHLNKSLNQFFRKRSQLQSTASKQRYAKQAQSSAGFGVSPRNLSDAPMIISSQVTQQEKRLGKYSRVSVPWGRDAHFGPDAGVKDRGAQPKRTFMDSRLAISSPLSDGCKRSLIETSDAPLLFSSVLEGTKITLQQAGKQSRKAREDKTPREERRARTKEPAKAYKDTSSVELSFQGKPPGKHDDDIYDHLENFEKFEKANKSTEDRSLDETGRKRSPQRPYPVAKLNLSPLEDAREPSRRENGDLPGFVPLSPSQLVSSDVMTRQSRRDNGTSGRQALDPAQRERHLRLAHQYLQKKMIKKEKPKEAGPVAAFDPVANSPGQHKVKDSAYLNKVKKKMQSNLLRYQAYQRGGISEFQKKMMRRSCGLGEHAEVPHLAGAHEGEWLEHASLGRAANSNECTPHSLPTSHQASTQPAGKGSEYQLQQHSRQRNLEDFFTNQLFTQHKLVKSDSHGKTTLQVLKQPSNSAISSNQMVYPKENIENGEILEAKFNENNDTEEGEAKSNGLVVFPLRSATPDAGRHKHKKKEGQIERGPEEEQAQNAGSKSPAKRPTGPAFLTSSALTDEPPEERNDQLASNEGLDFAKPGKLDAWNKTPQLHT